MPSITYFILKHTLCFLGKTYSPDPRIPSSVIFQFFMQRILWLTRGILYLRHKAFIGKNTKFLCKKNLHLGKWITFSNNVKIDACATEKIIIGDNVSFGPYSEISSTSHLSKMGKGIEIGHHTGIGAYCFFGAAGKIKIGDNVIMGQYVTFHAQDHVFTDPNVLIRDQGVSEKGITINDDCWIGAKVTILDGTIVGKHSVIAAGAVVKGNFPDNVVIGGVPAKIIKHL